MKILHTSDWHLGQSLCGQKRQHEFSAFLDWLVEIITQNEITALLVAGDIFDTTTPGAQTQGLYYRFLSQVATSCCRHLVIIGGNHDSPSLLNAPQEILKSLNVYVLGQATDPIDDEVLILKDAKGAPELIVCAVPYLRDRDVRQSSPGESLADKDRKLLEGIKLHYGQIAAIAEEKRNGEIPVVAMGHLFAAGSQVSENSGVRDLYVGSLGQVGADIFAEVFDYVALGHIHAPQEVAGRAHIRYSGSPLPLSFGESGVKSICQVTFSGRKMSDLELIEVPIFQSLERICGDWEAILERLEALKAAESDAWLEVVYDGTEIITDLRGRLEEIIAETSLVILRIRNQRIIDGVLRAQIQGEELAELDPQEVFERRLELLEQSDLAEKEELRAAYGEILLTLYADDGEKGACDR